MSSIRKSMRRESRCRMASIWSAPSDVRATGPAAAGFGGGAAWGFARPKSASVSGESAPLNKMLKKLRKARRIRFKSKTPTIQDSSLLPKDHLAQALQLSARDLGPLSRVVELEIGLPVVHGLHRLAGAFTKEREVEVGVGIVRIQIQREFVMLLRLLHAALLIIQIAEIELRERVSGVHFDGALVELFRLRKAALPIINGTEIHQRSGGARVQFQNF